MTFDTIYNFTIYHLISTESESGKTQLKRKTSCCSNIRGLEAMKFVLLAAQKSRIKFTFFFEYFIIIFQQKLFILNLIIT
jgi:hypothetical protein